MVDRYRVLSHLHVGEALEMFFPYYDWKADKIRCSKYWRRRVYYARRKWAKRVVKVCRETIYV